MERFKLGIGMKLLGLRKVEEGQDYLVIKLPWWATGAMADQAIDDVMRDRASAGAEGALHHSAWRALCAVELQ